MSHGQRGSAMLLALVVVVVTGIVAAGIHHRTNQTLAWQDATRGTAEGYQDIRAAVAVTLTFFNAGDLVADDAGARVTLAYTSPQRPWRISVLEGAPTLNVDPCYDASAASRLVALPAASPPCSAGTRGLVALRFLRRDADSGRFVVEARRALQNRTLTQLVLLDTAAYGKVPPLTCVYRLRAGDDATHFYDNRGAVGDSGTASYGRAVRWNVAQTEVSWATPVALTSVKVGFVLTIGGVPRFLRAGEAIPPEIDFARPVAGQLRAIVVGDWATTLTSPTIADLRPYFTVGGGVDGAVSPEADGPYTRVTFKACAPKYQTVTVSIASMCRYGGEFPIPYPGATPCL